MHSRKPDFFIVGAPRCGTTAMYEFLREHPQIFMPDHKEPHYFGDDLSHPHGRLTTAEYLRLFRPAKAEQRAGEASTWYLYSRSAAREISRFAPDAQIIVMLRNPIEVMYSLHRNLTFYGEETISDFAEALAAEPDRRKGRRVGRGRRREWLLYRDAVRFPDQLARYLHEFDKRQIRVILYDDFARNTEATYAQLLDFLAVDVAFRPVFRTVNDSKRPLLASIQEFIVRPPAPIARWIPMVRRSAWAHRMRATILKLNSRAEVRSPLDEELRRELAAELDPQVEALESMLGRDLTAWKSGSVQRHHPPSTPVPPSTGWRE
jgi:hypothetical protein